MKNSSSASKATSGTSTLIAVDIGNTAATCGLFKSGALELFESCLHDEIPNFVKKCRISGKNSSINVIISSVVPKATLKFKEAFKGQKARFWVVGENVKVPFKHKYRSIKQLGADRIVNVYGALKRFKPPLLVIDFGTAITFDYVSEKGVFEGGMIVPGPELSFEALIRKAARLPKDARLPHRTSSFLGTTTYDCMKSGILEGYGAMADGLVHRFKQRFGTNLKVIATGGFASHLRPYTHSFDVLDPQLSIYALHTLFLGSTRLR